MVVRVHSLHPVPSTDIGPELHSTRRLRQLQFGSRSGLPSLELPPIGGLFNIVVRFHVEENGLIEHPFHSILNRSFGSPYQFVLKRLCSPCALCRFFVYFCGTTIINTICIYIYVIDRNIFISTNICAKLL